MKAMKSHSTPTLYLLSLCLTVMLALSACKTKPMYTEGDVHFEATCVEADVEICIERLKKACDEYEGEVVEIDVRREKYISEQLKAELRKTNVKAQSVHLTCRPPAKEQEDNLEQTQK